MARGGDETAPDEHPAAFARWLERTPSRKHRSEADRRRSGDAKFITLGPARSPGTVDGILTAVVEFARFGSSRGWSDVEAINSLSAGQVVRFLPPGFARRALELGMILVPSERLFQGIIPGLPVQENVMLPVLDP